MRLSADEPTASIYGLVRCGCITVIPEAIKPTTIKLLDTAVYQGFNDGKDPIDNLFITDIFESTTDSVDAEALKNFFRNLQRLQALVRLKILMHFFSHHSDQPTRLHTHQNMHSQSLLVTTVSLLNVPYLFLSMLHS